MSKLAVAYEDAYVGDTFAASVEKYEISSLKILFGYLLANLRLCCRCARKLDLELAEYIGGEAGAVKAARSGATRFVLDANQVTDFIVEPGIREDARSREGHHT